MYFTTLLDIELYWIKSEIKELKCVYYWIKLKENSENNEERRAREDITCYMCTSIIDHKIPIIWI